MTQASLPLATLARQHRPGELGRSIVLHWLTGDDLPTPSYFFPG